jgi:hypothetical protein
VATTEITSLFSKGMTRHFNLEYKELNRVCDRIFHVNKTESRFVDAQGWELFDQFDTRLPGEPVKQAAIRESFGKRYTVVNYGLGDTIPFEDWKDDQYGVLNRLLPKKGGALARAWNVTRERICADMFKNLAYKSGTSIAGSPDGVSLFNTAHPVSKFNSATTKSNRPSTDADLSIATYQAAITNLGKQAAPNNVEFIDNAPRLLVVENSQQYIAKQILKGDWEIGTADRNLNVVKGIGDVLVWSYFEKSGATGTNNAWFVVGENHSLNIFDRQELEMDSDEDISTQSFIFVATARMVVGFDDWRGTFGSTGS